jgi:hypothetical protein
MFKFKVPDNLLALLVVLFIIFTLTECVFALLPPYDFKVVRETNTVLVLREVRNHGWNISSPITLYKIPAACSEPPHAMECHFLTQEDGHTYPYIAYWNNYVDLRDNLNRIERMRQQEHQQQANR